MPSPAFDQLLDTCGLAAPLPLLKARHAFNQLHIGQVLKVVCSDSKSVADFKGWAKTAPNLKLLAQETQTGDHYGHNRYIHYLQRAE